MKFKGLGKMFGLNNNIGFWVQIQHNI